MGLPRCDHIIIGCLALHHQPHRLYILGSIAPVALCLEVAEIELLLDAGANPRDRARDLPCDEALAPAWRLVVEEYPVTDEHPIALPVVLRDPVRIDLRAAIGRTGVERRGLRLRHLLHKAIHLA